MFGFPFGFPGGNQQGDNDQYDQQEGNQGQQQETQQPDNQQYYKVLQVTQQSSTQQIKEAYERILKQQEEKQKDADEQKIKKIKEAYQVLSDPQKRQIYNTFGKAALQQQQEGGNDLMSMIFGGGKKKKGKNQQLPKVQSTKKALPTSLQSIYNGQKLEIPHTRTRCCQKCGGKGGQNINQCKECNGQGIYVQMYQMGPGMYQQVQKKCDKCQGQGQIIGEGGKCQQCEGKKILQKEKNIEVNLQKGTPNNFAIKIQNQGNQIPKALPGDLYFIVQQKPHETFTRQGADLFMKKDITLLEALTGFQFQLKHLDGKQYTIKTQEGQVISDEDKKIVKGLGMPYYKKAEQYGNLVIQFHVVMPKRDQITKQQVNELVKLLPGERNQRPPGQYQMFQDFDIQKLNTNEQGGKKPDDQYDPQAEQQGVYCPTH